MSRVDSSDLIVSPCRRSVLQARSRRRPLLLAAQYESWTLPFGVLLGTPIANFGAVAALWLHRFELDVFSQIGLIMVIGLAAKNAILIVEFCKDEYERGAPLFDAALTGARIRLRPILMTAFAFVFAVLPLVVS